MIRFVLRRLVLMSPDLLVANFAGFSFAHLVRPIQLGNHPYFADLIDPAPPASHLSPSRDLV